MNTIDINKNAEDLVASVAHEIKNPLALIKAHLQVLELADEDGEHEKNYMVLYGEIEKINSLLMEFITLSKPQNYSFKKIILSNFINETVRKIKPMADEKKIDFQLEYIDKEAYMVGDYEKLEQVLINVVKNSIEAVGNKGIINISYFEYEDYITINVADNGEGISETNKENIGKPFFTTKESGSGLGLSISKKIVDGHNGTLMILGVEGKGSVASITLPKQAMGIKEKYS